jgi:hypothetical protein
VNRSTSASSVRDPSATPGSGRGVVPEPSVSDTGVKGVSDAERRYVASGPPRPSAAWTVTT